MIFLNSTQTLNFYNFTLPNITQIESRLALSLAHI